MDARHAVVFVDHLHAQVVYLNPDHPGFAERRIGANGRGPRDAGAAGAEHHTFFDSVAEALSRCEAIIVAGPDSVRVRLSEYLRAFWPDVALRVIREISVDGGLDSSLHSWAREQLGEHLSGRLAAG